MRVKQAILPELAYQARADDGQGGEQTNKFTFTLKKIATKPAILKVTTIPEGAEVYIDGLLVGISNNSFTISEGTHEILIRLEGYQDYVATITVKGGEVRTISVTLKEK